MNSFLLRPFSFIVCSQVVFLAGFIVVNSSVGPSAFFSFLSPDFFSGFGQFLLACFTLFFLFCCESTLKTSPGFVFEFFLLVLFSLLSSFLIVGSSDFLSLYLSLEFQALAFYVLASFFRFSSFSTEAGLKYFILGAFASGLLLFGLSLLYGFLGTTNYSSIGVLLGSFSFYSEVSFSFQLLFGFGLVLISFFFKLTVAPFHSWAADVYEGCPAVSAFFFALLPKVALVFALGRLCISPFFGLHIFWQACFLLVGLLSIAFGSFGAVYQKRFRRFLVFSSVSHMGFILVAFGTGTAQGFLVGFFYTVVYLVTTLGVWSLVVSTQVTGGTSLRYLSNLFWIGKQNSFFSLVLCVLFFSIAGVPPLAGFGAKLFVFLSLIDSNFFFMSLCGVVFAVVGCFYYLRVIKVLFFESQRSGSFVTSQIGHVAFFSRSSAFSITLCIFLCIVLYAIPGSLLLVIHKAVVSLLL